MALMSEMRRGRMEPEEVSDLYTGCEIQVCDVKVYDKVDVSRGIIMYVCRSMYVLYVLKVYIYEGVTVWVYMRYR